MERWGQDGRQYMKLGVAGIQILSIQEGHGVIVQAEHAAQHFIHRRHFRSGTDRQNTD